MENNLASSRRQPPFATRAAALLLVAAASLSFSACGGAGSSPGSPSSASKQSPSETALTYLNALQEGDGETACGLMTEGMQSMWRWVGGEMGGEETCEGGVIAKHEQSPEVYKFSTKQKKATEREAVVVATGTSPEANAVYTMTLEKDGDKWLVTDDIDFNFESNSK